MSTESSKKRKDKRRKKDGDREHLVDSSEDGSSDSGSGLCSKLIFVLLFAGLAVSVGVIFFELGGSKFDLTEQIREPHVHEEILYDSVTEKAAQNDLSEEDGNIEPTFLDNNQEELVSEDAAAVEEEVDEARAQQVESEPETVPIAEVEEALPETVEYKQEQGTQESELEAEGEVTPEPIETMEEGGRVEEVSPVQDEVEPQLPKEEEAPVSQEPEPSVQVEEAPVTQEVETKEEEPAVVEEETTESYTERAEREAVQQALEQVWVLSARCVEELRAFHTVMKSQQSHDVVEDVTLRLTPLRDELNTLLEKSTQSPFDGLLEQVSALENKLLGILNDLDKAREAEETLPEAVDMEELSADEVQLAEAAAVPTEDEEETEVLADNGEDAEDTLTEQNEQGTEPSVVHEVSDELTNADTKEVVEELTAEPSVFPQDKMGDQAEVPIGAVPVKEDAAIEAEKIGEYVPVGTVDTVEITPETEQPTQDSADNEIAAADAPEVVEEVVHDEPEKPATAEEVKPSEQENKPGVSDSAAEQPEETLSVTESKVPQSVGEQQPASKTSDEHELNMQLHEAGSLIDQSPHLALQRFERILQQRPNLPLALYGRAETLDKLAEQERSNSRLEQAIFAFRSVLDQEHEVDDILYRKAAERCIDRMRFRGFTGKAIRIQQRLISRFPNDLALRNQLAVSFLMVGQPPAAKEVLEEVLQRWPDSGFAKVHYGFLLKTTYNDNEGGARYMAEGIATKENGVIDGRFFFHLGDALARMGRTEEAREVYAEGEKEGLFLSRDQRSLYNVDRLTGRPWWTREETTYPELFNQLEANWKDIRDEGIALLKLTKPEGFKDESENLRDTGDWKQFELFSRGRRTGNNCLKAPKTCAIVEKFPAAAQCKRGQIKFSIMHPGTHVWPHTGPTNCRLRAHLGLVVPGGASMRVGNETRTWEEGKVFIFDDSFEHEVWHNGDSYRLILIVDVWHPELTEQERMSLSPI